MRVLLAMLLTVIAFATIAAAAAEVTVEDWSKMTVGAKGIPVDWKGQNWGSPAYDMTVVEEGGRKVLHLKSRGDGSTVSKDVKGKIDLKRTPILEWSWKAVVLPK